MRRHHYKPYLGEGGIVSKPAVTTDGVTARYERFSHSGTTWYDLTPNPANGTDSPTVTATITGVTQANPGVVTCSGGHSYADNTIVFISGVGGMTQLNDKTYTVKNATATTFELYDATPAPAAVDTTGYDAYTSGGTATRGALTWPFFNGTASVNFGLPAKLDFADAFTALVWANQSTAIPRQTKERVISRDAGAGTNRSFILEQRDDTGIISGYLWVGGSAAPDIIDSPAVYNTDTYHFICLVNEGAGGDIKLYIDGELIGTEAGDGGAMNLATSNLYAGRPHSGMGDWFTGQIDTVRFYDRALSADEILRDYYAGVPAHS